MNCSYIIGIRMDNRVSNAKRLQEVLTENGCKIKTRLGMHEVGDDECANYGMIMLQPCGEPAEIERLVRDLNAMDGVTAKMMDLNQP